jgi:hypothetical protein
MHRQMLACLLAFAPLIPRSEAQGTVRWNWTFDQTKYIVGPADSFTVTATVFVHPDSARPLTTPSISGSYAGPLQAFYDFNCGFCADQKFADFNLPPGQSYQFLFGTFTPKSSVGAGTYVSDPALLIFTGSGQRGPDTYFQVQVIPEPTALNIFMLGAAAFTLRSAWVTRGSQGAKSVNGSARPPGEPLHPEKNPSRTTSGSLVCNSRLQIMGVSRQTKGSYRR